MKLIMKNLFRTRELFYFTLYSILSCLTFESPIFVVFLVGKGITYSQVTYLFALYSFLVFAFEYVTGIIADKYSRKSTLMFSTAFLILGEMFFVMGSNIYYFMVGMVFMSVSVASKSGADMAYIYDKFIELKQQDSFDDFISNLGSAMFIASAFVFISGSFLTKFGSSLPFIGTIIAYLFCLLILFKFKEPLRESKEVSAKNIIKKNVITILYNKVLLGVILVSLLVVPSYHLLDSLLQPYLESNNIGVEFFGLFYFLFTIAESTGAKISGNLNKKFNFNEILVITAFIVSFGFLIMSLTNSLVVYITPIILGISFGIYCTINSIAVNKLIESDIRASLYSLQHALTKVVQGVFLLLIGLSIDRFSLRTSFLYIGLILIIGIATIFLVCNNKVKFNYNKKNENNKVGAE
ncbi:MFS transporter [Clostridium taeniosporum]|uniref:MFS transporter n=2 Tax=Clostridium taeniosporum TaxID=394958 RepID=A0A1D7XH10_9CLOT|nr:MFS transporter [Clostridium taeniosporum]